MKATGNKNINTKEYWDGIYGSPDKRHDYATHGTSIAVQEGTATARFTTALKEVKNGDKFLDIGCGVGVLTQLVKSTHPECEVYGVDISSKAIEDNKKENPTIHYSQGTVNNLSFDNEMFDVIFSGEVLEHLDDPQVLLTEGFRLLKDGGKMIVTTPLMDSIHSPEHTWFFTQEDVEEFYIKAGFKNIKFVYLPNQEHLMVIFALGTK